MISKCPMLLSCRRPRKCHNNGVVGYVSTLKQCHMLWASQNRAAVLVQIPAWTKMPVSRAFCLLSRASCEILTFLPCSVWCNQSVEGREAQCCFSICESNVYWFDYFFFLFYINTAKLVSSGLSYYLYLAPASFWMLSKKMFLSSS